MAIDKEKYIAQFITEGYENIALVERLVFDIKDGVSVEDDLATVLRALHTLKGLSRMLEFKRLEEITHSMESVFIAVRDKRIGLTENAVKMTIAAVDMIKEGLALVQSAKDDEIDIQEYVKILSALAANEEFMLPENISQKSPRKGAGAGSESADEDAQSEDAAGGGAYFSDEKRPPASKRQRKNVKSDSIRLSLEKIDNIIKSIASLQTLEISAKSISVESAALNRLVKEFSAKLKNSKNRDPSMTAIFRKMERLSERVNTELRNYTVDTSNNIRGAYDTVISLRTLPLSTVLDNYQRYVFQLSDELGKKVQLVIEGKENEIDKNIIETLSEVFMHMIRNAIDHGVETPQKRVAAGKSETAKLTIICSRESGSMKIVISDDGRGVNYEKIRRKIIGDGIVTETAAAALSNDELISYIFQSGFSTSGKVSNVSGRGVGMDVVRESIETMKGSVVVDSVQGQGTSFTIMVPLSIAALMGFPITSGGMKFIIPSTFVETILLIGSDDIVTVIERPEIKYNDRLIKLYYLSQILQIKAEAADNSEVIFVVIIRAYDDVVALVVDDVSSMRSVILKTMPAFMESMSLFSGIVLNDDYEMVSVLHIPTVIKMARRIKTIDFKKRNLEFEKLRKSILVVDDSRPTREIEKDILASEGYLVDTAADGAEALKAAKAKQYDLICTDINMPVMDGFMLTENIKKNEELSRIPVIIISSMESEEHQKRAALLGASRYIVKNSFDNHNLLAAVKELIGGTGE